MTQPLLALALDGSLEIVDRAVDVVVARQEFFQPSQVLRCGQSKTIQLAHCVTALFLGEFFPFGNALQVLNAFFQPEILLV